MDWVKEIPKEPGYYFLNDYDCEILVEVVLTKNGAEFFECRTNNICECSDLSCAMWLGPIKSEDIINLWKNFNEQCDYNQGIVDRTRKYDKKP